MWSPWPPVECLNRWGDLQFGDTRGDKTIGSDFWIKRFHLYQLFAKLKEKLQCGYQTLITVHLNKQLGLDSAACLVFIRGASAATDRVYFVNENSCRCIKSGLQTKEDNSDIQQKHSLDFITYARK